MKIENNYDSWLSMAKNRTNVIMCDGRHAILTGVKRNTGTCIIKMGEATLKCDAQAIERANIHGFFQPVYAWPLPDDIWQPPQRTGRNWFRARPV